MATREIVEQGECTIQDPPIARVLFHTTTFAWLFLLVRLWLGYDWLSHGLEKLSNPAWMQTGEALKGFFTRAVTTPEGGRPPIAFDWYRGFIQFMLETESYTWFAKLVVFGEMLVGVGLILGAFVGIAAFFGAFMNWNFIMAGTASSNGLLFVIAIFLMLGWKVAGYYGLDFYLLRFVGVPWNNEQPPRVRPVAGAAD